MLHFAYGSNMHRGVMRRHASTAIPIGAARLQDYRFVITGDGYASVEPARAEAVHGVLWCLSPRDRVTLDLWENIASGLYRAATLSVRSNGSCRSALTYIARSRPPGRPKAGYMEIVIGAGRTWKLPGGYIAALERWLQGRPGSAGHRELGEFS